MILVSMIEVDYQDDEERPNIRQLKHLSWKGQIMMAVTTTKMLRAMTT